MAEFSKYKSYAIGHLLEHNNRVKDDGTARSNEKIDNERTIFNYYFKKGTIKDIEKRLSEVFYLKRSNLSVLGEMIVTLPKDVPKEDERAFFDAVYEFYCNDLGEENIINAVVHKDETRPHIHIDFIPIVAEKFSDLQLNGRNNYYAGLRNWKEQNNKADDDMIYRLCCKSKITKKYLETMHPRLSNYIKQELGYRCEIINGETDRIGGNKTILQLKTQTLKKETENEVVRLETIKSEIQEYLNFVNRHGYSSKDMGMLPLLKKIENLENENSVYKEIIHRQNYMYSKEDLIKLKSKKIETLNSVKLNVIDDYMNIDNIEDNAIVVIELPNKIERKLPQTNLIEFDADLYRHYRMANEVMRPVICRNSKLSNRVYIFLKTDNETDTLNRLLEMANEIKKLEDYRTRTLYIEHFESDTYYFAKSILEQTDIKANYYTKHYSADNDNDKIRQITTEKE